MVVPARATSMSHRCLLLLSVALLVALLAACAGGPTSDFPVKGGDDDGAGDNGGDTTGTGAANPGPPVDAGGGTGGTTGGTASGNNGGAEGSDAGAPPVDMDAGIDDDGGSLDASVDASEGDAAPLADDGATASSS